MCTHYASGIGELLEQLGGEEEILYGTLIYRQFVISEDGRVLLAESNLSDFRSSLVYISKCFCTTLGVNEEKTKTIIDSVEKGMSNAHDVFGCLSFLLKRREIRKREKTSLSCQTE